MLIKFQFLLLTWSYFKNISEITATRKIARTFSPQVTRSFYLLRRRKGHLAFSCEETNHLAYSAFISLSVFIVSSDCIERYFIDLLCAFLQSFKRPQVLFGILFRKLLLAASRSFNILILLIDDFNFVTNTRV